MYDMNTCINCAGLKVHYSFLYPGTSELFEKYLDKDCNKAIDLEVHITSDYLKETSWLTDENETSCVFKEFQSLMLATGNQLLVHKRALFHGAALSWNNKAWIFTAPSGTGKTTQIKHWRTLLKKKVKIINGDKPILQIREDGIIIVHSSPWRGKEKMGISGLNSELGGIVLLEQGKTNHIERMNPDEAVIPLFIEFIAYPDNSEQIQAQSEILNHILKNVPVWKLINVGDEESARLTIETVSAYQEETHDGI